MGGASSYLAMLAICGFLSATWMATKVSKLAGVSSIVLEITTGVILGPRVLQLISPEYAVCEHQRHAECELPPDFMERLDKGLPVGATMGRIVNMDYCDRHAYAHHGDDHAGGHGESHNEADGHGHGAVGNHTGNHTGEHGESDGHGENHSETGGHGENRSETHGHGEEHGEGHGHAENKHPHTDTGVDDEAPIGVPSPVRGQDDTDGSAQHHAEEHSNETEAPEEQHGDAHGEGGHGSEHGATHGDEQGHHRRLSGGGGATYASYEECLEKSCESDVSHHCGLTPDVFTLIGHAGVALMIFESGMHFDFEKALVVGPKACVVAVVGTLLPLITGTLLTMIYGYPMLPDGVSVGTALAPTSVGIALRLLGEAGVLQHDFGQAIITAAFVDDILSLVLFNVLFSLRGDFNVMATVVNPIIGVTFMGIAMVLAVKFWPKAINEWILPRLPKKSGDPKVSSDDEGLFLIMMALLIAYATATHFLGTHLWGCFIAGMSFACIDKEGHKGHTHHVWVRQTKRMTSWMIRIFFSCTVAFSIPISKLLSFEAFWKGSIMGIGPCILTKVLCAPFMGRARFVIGWAMVGRAEFAYLIAQMAAAASMIDEATFSICIWALLYATIFAPFIFRTVLNRYIAAEGIQAEEGTSVDDHGAGLVEERFDHFEPQTKHQGDFSGAMLDTTFGKRMEDLEGITIEGVADGQKEKYKRERGSGTYEDDGVLAAPGAEDMAGDGATPRVRRKLWWGRQPASNPATSNNGFLCCLFFKKIVLN